MGVVHTACQCGNRIFKEINGFEDERAWEYWPDLVADLNETGFLCPNS